MATVNLQKNPDVAITGTRDADAVIITSEISPPDVGTLVNYQIEILVSFSYMLLQFYVYTLSINNLWQ